MAISKIIYKSSAEAEGEIWMDVTGKTVTSGSMLSGTTALKNDGTDITGNIATKTSANLSASGATVTAPAGYYATDASKSVASGTAGTPAATKGTVSSNSVTVTPSVTNTAGYISGGTLTGTAVTVSASELVSGTKSITASGTTDVTNYANASVAAGSAATPATNITANPSISVSSGGLITASVSTSQSVTPTVSAGFVSSGTSGTVSVSGSNTEQLTTQAAQTIHPSTTDQTIASGKYLTGTQTVKGVLLTNLSAGNIKKDVVVKVGDSTDDDCVTSVTGTFEGGTTPSGILYMYSDIDGEGAWDHTVYDGYEKFSYDFAPVKDNKFRFWIEVDSSDLTFTPPISVPTSSAYRYTGAIDWGDGTTPTEFAYGNTDHTHTYASPGRYCVEIWRTGGAEYFSIDNPSSDAVRAKIIAVEFYFIGYPTNVIKKLYNVRKLRYSSQQTTISLVDYNSLTDVILPDSATTLSNCYRLYALQKLVIPASVTTIAGGCFTNCTAMKEYHFLPTTPPTLGDANVFNYIPSDCVIYVPQGSLTAYQTATNWSTYASHIQEEPS